MCTSRQMDPRHRIRPTPATNGCAVHGSGSHVFPAPDGGAHRPRVNPRTRGAARDGLRAQARPEAGGSCDASELALSCHPRTHSAARDAANRNDPGVLRRRCPHATTSSRPPTSAAADPARHKRIVWWHHQTHSYFEPVQSPTVGYLCARHTKARHPVSSDLIAIMLAVQHTRPGCRYQSADEPGKGITKPVVQTNIGRAIWCEAQKILNILANSDATRWCTLVSRFKQKIHCRWGHDFRIYRETGLPKRNDITEYPCAWFSSETPNRAHEFVWHPDIAS